MVLQTDIDLILEYFELAPRYRGMNPELANITAYKGKHILERIREQGYMEMKEFISCMDALNIDTFKNSKRYPIRLKKPYRHMWKCV